MDWSDLDFTSSNDGAEGDWIPGNSPLSPQDEAILALQSLGLSELEGYEIVVDLANVKDISLLRASRFQSITDAVYWLVDTGLIYIGSRVVTMPSGETTVEVPNESVQMALYSWSLYDENGNPIEPEDKE